jgi:MipA family protein
MNAIKTISILACAASMVAGATSANAQAIPAGITVTIGASGVYQPKYQGSKDSEFTVAPIIKFGSASGGDATGLLGGLDVRGFDDIGFGLLKAGNFQMGPAFGYREDRSESESPRLRGLGDVDDGLVIGAFAKYTFQPFFLRASYLHSITGDDTGGLLKLLVGADYKLNPQVMLHWFTGVEVGDSNYMQTYFGVTAAQAARSAAVGAGLQAFKASGGAKSYNLGVSADYEVIPTWTLTASAEYVHYLGDAARSPIVEEADQLIGKIGISKTFNLRF